MPHIISGSVPAVIFSCFLFSCAPSSSTVQNGVPEAEQQYPEWYSSETVVSDDSLFYGYGTAIGADSGSVAEMAASRAVRNLRSAVSEKIESIRSEATAESDSEAEIDAPQFILSLRKAENSVADVAETRQVEVKRVESYDGYRAFSEVAVAKEELLHRMENMLSAHAKAWNALKESPAFDEF